MTKMFNTRSIRFALLSIAFLGVLMLSQLVYIAPAGAAANATINVSSNITASWSLSPGGSSASQTTYQSHQVSFTGGSAQYTITPGYVSGYTSTCSPSCSVTVTPNDSKTVNIFYTVVNAPTITLTANPQQISSGQSSSLSWSASDADICYHPVTGAGTSVSGSVSVSPTKTTTYTVSCTNYYSGEPGLSCDTHPYSGCDSTSASQNVTVQVASQSAPTVSITNITPTRNLTVEPTVVVNIGATFEWEGATDTADLSITIVGGDVNQTLKSESYCFTQTPGCTFSDGSGPSYYSGTFAAPVKRDVTYTVTYFITAKNSTGQVSQQQITRTITVPKVTEPAPDGPLVELIANPESIELGESSVLTASSSNAVRCDRSWSTSTAISSVDTITPSSTDTYTITCYNVDDDSATDTAQVTVSDNSGGPNLIITSPVTYSPSPASEGDDVSYSVPVRNSGDAATTQNTILYYQLDLHSNGGGWAWDESGNVSTPALAVGQTYTSSFPEMFEAVEGTHIARFCADYTDLVVESDETDNCYSFSFTVAEAEEQATLNVQSSGASGVSISRISGPSDIAGTTNYTRSYDEGFSAVIQAPDTVGGASFTSWTGCGSESSRNCSISVDDEETKTVTANYSGGSFNYTMSNSGVVTVEKGASDAYGQSTITKTLTAGTTQSVDLSVSGAPSGVTYTYSSRTCSPDCTSTINFTVTPSAPVGDHTITVTGSPLSKTTSFTLRITGSPMSITCTPSPATAVIGQPVTWTANVSGGTSPYTYSWSGSGMPTSPAPSANPYTLTYSTIGQKTATVQVTDANSGVSSCPAGSSVQVNFNPQFEEF